jgi:hypothetical protein
MQLSVVVCRCSTAASVLGRLPLLSLGLETDEATEKKLTRRMAEKRDKHGNTEVRIANRGYT